MMEFGISLSSRGPTASMKNLRTLAQPADLQRTIDRFVQEVQPGVSA